MRPVWIDTDAGFDDLAAILTVLARPDIAVDGISLVAGNTPLDGVVRNACRMKAFFGWRAPLHAGRDRPLLGPLVTAQDVLGEDGMRTAGRSLPDEQAPLDGRNALAAMAAWLERSEAATVLALGPLTNLAALLLARPDLAARIGEVMWMGGSADRGNHTAAAEFNAFVDPEAVAVVLGSGVPFRMVGLDACRQVPVRLADAAALRACGTPRALLLADLLEGYVRIASPDGSRPMALYDPVAAAALLDAQAVRFDPMHVAVELAGTHTRGMTVCEWRIPRKAEANARVAVQADADRVRGRVLAALAGKEPSQ
ncbi:nucleoside hydrolase [Marinimicrococcus flavescens]|uniref:Nucleoside hydrolase n=1 Tax=Marinimicrococcus flavescens TaxID=3031815 RepID=A0AAP3XS60_9PROT|nr:nucleoside hydrolase [Marinimicrococcus flavescens]